MKFYQLLLLISTVSSGVFALKTCKYSKDAVKYFNENRTCDACDKISKYMDYEIMYNDKDYDDMYPLVESVCKLIVNSNMNECNIILKKFKFIYFWIKGKMNSTEICTKLQFCNYTKF